MAAESAGLQVEGICKRFGRLNVLRGVALAAPRGRVTALLGPNGAGKSTLFQILMGLTSCDQGRATMDGRDLLALPLHRKAQAGLGYLPQESASFPELTARENLLALLEILPMDRGQREARLGWLVSRMGLTEFLDREAGKLSGGEQKRLEIAKALAGQPRVLLLDEPFSGLDPRIIEDLVQILQGLAAEGIGILLTDHNVHMTLEFVHYAYLLAGGTILCEGTPRQITANPDARRMYLGDRFRVEEA